MPVAAPTGWIYICISIYRGENERSTILLVQSSGAPRSLLAARITSAVEPSSTKRWRTRSTGVRPASTDSAARLSLKSGSPRSSSGSNWAYARICSKQPGRPVQIVDPNIVRRQRSGPGYPALSGERIPRICAMSDQKSENRANSAV
jgi:hypothetical protein